MSTPQDAGRQALCGPWTHSVMKRGDRSCRETLLLKPPGSVAGRVQRVIEKGRCWSAELRVAKRETAQRQRPLCGCSQTLVGGLPHRRLDALANRTAP